jgi:hypothetical protein
VVNQRLEILARVLQHIYHAVLCWTVQSSTPKPHAFDLRILQQEISCDDVSWV